jgi:peptidyl-prolyl cis-trans isomerase D
VSGKPDYDEAFFKQLDAIENKVLDGKSFNETSKDNNLKVIKISKINKKKEDLNKNKINSITNALFNKIYNMKNTKSAEVISLEGKYFLAEIINVEKKNKSIDDPEVQKALKAQISFKNKIEKNTSIAKDIGLGAYEGNNFKKFADDNNLEVKNYKISSLKQNEIFAEGLVKRIFLTNDNETNLITNSSLTKTFLILTKKTDYKKLNKSSNDYEKYEAKARLNLINKIYKSYDDSVNQKYKVELNQRTIDRVKNSF